MQRRVAEPGTEWGAAVSWQPVLFRPFRHLCGEADLRDAMTDEEFWQHVFGRDGWDEEYGASFDGPGDPMLRANGVTNPCPECGEYGACAYDADGRPLIHAREDDER